MGSGKGGGGGGEGGGGGGAGAEIPEHVSADDREMRTTCVAWVRAAPTPTAPPRCLSFSRWHMDTGPGLGPTTIVRPPFPYPPGLGGGVVGGGGGVGGKGGREINRSGVR